MNAHQLDANGVIINTIVVDDLNVFPSLVDASIGGAIGDRIINGAIVPAPAPAPVVPQKVTRRQGRQALLLAGKLDQVPLAIAAIEDETERRMAQIEWEDAQEYERQRPLVVMMGAALGLDLDALFIHAASL